MPKPSPTQTKTARPEWLLQFGRRLLLARSQAGLTQQSLGAPDLSKSFISLLETGRSHPSVETVVSLARRTQTSVGSLLLDEPELRRETATNLLQVADRMDPGSQGDQIAQFIAAAEALLPDMPGDMAVRVALVRAHTAMLANRLDDATRWADRAESVAARHRLGGAVAKALAFKGMIAARQGSHASAISILERAVEGLRRSKAARTQEGIWALLSMGAARFYLGEISRARRAYQRALDLATRLRIEHLRGRAMMGLGMLERARKRLDIAVEFLSKAHRSFEQVEDLTEVGRALTNLGLVRREQGLLSEAHNVLERALRVKERLGNPRELSTTLDELARVLLELNRLGEAARVARRAIATARSAGDRSRVAAAQVTLAHVLRAQGRQREAAKFFKTAAAAFRRLGVAEQAAAASAELERMLKSATAKTRGQRRSRRLPQRNGAVLSPGSPLHAVEGLPLP
jgi:tetratricopeptide (TPR) repeat protein